MDMISPYEETYICDISHILTQMIPMDMISPYGEIHMCDISYIVTETTSSNV